MLHIINATVENQPGVLARIVSLFSGRGYNIETLNVGPSADPMLSKMTITLHGDSHVIEQVSKQLNKLIDVIKVVELTSVEHLERELILVEVATPKEKRGEVVELAALFEAKIVGVSERSLTLQYIGTKAQVENFVKLLRPYTIMDLSRSGLIAVARGD
ncbi:MAG: acetolactate synthase small subunit [Lentisphaerae bacterium]|jgi:acetolactate synthase-1/3 small subunit|nr:acetolactate synthase small subunit [Lentisphaerota bacterium]